MSLNLIIIAIVFAAVSGLPGLLLPRTSDWGQRIAAAVMGCGTVVGLAGVWSGLNDNQIMAMLFVWPSAGNSVIGIDALSLFFLVPVFLMGGLGSIYGLDYWPQLRYRRNGRKLRLFWGLLSAGMALLVIGRHAMAFLFGWEMMALSAFFLVSAEDQKDDCRRAGWIYLVATHICTLTLFAIFALWRRATGSYALTPAPNDAIGMGVMNILFFMSLIGFGLKAGIMPFHFWLPGAHANAQVMCPPCFPALCSKWGSMGWCGSFRYCPNRPPYGEV
jgi:hydrogenase-4 component B